MTSTETHEANGNKMTIRQTLESEAFKTTIAKLLPKHVTPERMARVAITALTRTPQLVQCEQASFFRCLMDLSQWGLEPDGRRAHLIPFNNNKRGCVECQLIIDYKGLVELAYRSGAVSNIHADVVCENDEFDYDRGELKTHRINFRKPRGNAYAAYCLIRMKDGTEKCEVLTTDEIEAVRKRSRAGDKGPWVTDWKEMAKKTAFRRVSKWIPLSSEIRDAAERDDDVLDHDLLDMRHTQNRRPALNDLTDRLLESDDTGWDEQRSSDSDAGEQKQEATTQKPARAKSKKASTSGESKATETNDASPDSKSTEAKALTLDELMRETKDRLGKATTELEVHAILKDQVAKADKLGDGDKRTAMDLLDQHGEHRIQELAGD